MEKFRNTCDMCSISKVRCDKNKPACGRCKRLGYSCNYSPARFSSKRVRPQSVENSQKCLEIGDVEASVPSITSSISSPAFSRPTSERNAGTVSSQLMPPEMFFSDVTENFLSLPHQTDFVFGSYDTYTNMDLIPDENSMIQVYDDGHAANQSHIQQLYRQYLPGPSREISEYYHNTGEVSATWGQDQVMSPATFDTHFGDHFISHHDYAMMATTCTHPELYQKQQLSRNSHLK